MPMNPLLNFRASDGLLPRRVQALFDPIRGAISLPAPPPASFVASFQSYRARASLPREARSWPGYPVLCSQPTNNLHLRPPCRVPTGLVFSPPFASKTSKQAHTHASSRPLILRSHESSPSLRRPPSLAQSSAPQGHSNGLLLRAYLNISSAVATHPSRGSSCLLVTPRGTAKKRRPIEELTDRYITSSSTSQAIPQSEVIASSFQDP
jgi:hypothetical protein